MGKALDRSGALQAQDNRRNQRGDVAVQNSGQRLLEACLNGALYRLACADFLPDTGEDNDIGIHGHTDTQNDTCDTRQGQGNLKCVQQT